MIERPLEKLLLVSRWLYACFFFPLLVGLAALVVKSVQRLFEVGPLVFSMSEVLLIVEVLKLVELTLTGALVVIMIFAGYANFVTRIDLSGHKDWPKWMTQVDFSGQKLWLMSAIIVISGIQLLTAFADISDTPDRDLRWSVIVFGIFVVSWVLLAVGDWLRGAEERAAR